MNSDPDFETFKDIMNLSCHDVVALVNDLRAKVAELKAENVRLIGVLASLKSIKVGKSDLDRRAGGG